MIWINGDAYVYNDEEKVWLRWGEEEWRETCRELGIP